ncbi:ATP-binding protein [Pedobacter sp. WC2501]|uniref:ATP-binding protein n=1 Tax=Pedobacter sp. WC2501 TaxID=3461400 RepID=UPI00404531C8
MTDAFPDLYTQRLALLNTVFKTGIKKQYEVAYPLNAPEGQKENYARIFLNPVFNEKAEVSAIIVSAIDVSEQVIALKELERAYDQVSLSKLAAQLGTFDMDLKTGTMEWDQRCRELFGISHDSEVTYDKDFLTGLHPDDRERIQAVITSLFNKEESNGNYDVEYRTVGVQDNKVRWVRAKGKVYFDGDDRPVRFIGSVLDITDKKHEEQLRNDFIAMASHELKTPLTSLLACLQILERKAGKSEQDDSLLKQAGKQVVKMTRMINDFLNLSRLESGKLNLNLTEVAMSSLIKDVVFDVNQIHPGVRILVSDYDDISLLMDREKIEHVLLNLVNNAIKYSDPGMPIHINCSADSSTVTVSIRDEGIGINPKDQDKLFDRYYRVESPDARYVSGFGIGLYLSREIVYLHKGTIWVESEIGSGSTFYFTLPL